MNMNKISLEEMNELRSSYEKDSKARVVRNALKNNGIETISRAFESDQANPNVFSIDLHNLKVTNQMQSGRCWIFSATNILRNIVAKKLDLEQFELSQNYVAFYDKIEKVNWFMECTLQELDAPVDAPYNRFLLETAVGDGGQWDMVVSLIKKYGIVPKTAMPETYQSSHTNQMNHLLNMRLRKFVANARSLHKENKDDEIAALKKQCMKECYSLIVSCFGLPPKTFSFEYRNKKKEFHAEYDLTPKSFYEKYVGEDLDDYVTIINGPTDDKEYYHTYTVKYLGNVVDGNEIKYLNLPMEDFKQAVINQLKDGNCVWFGCDCSQYGDRTLGLWDDQQFDYENTFDIDLEMSKAEMLDQRVSAMNHAMVIDGVNLVDGKPNRWKIENSWSDKVANDGFYTMSDTWFDQFVYEAGVKKCYLDEKAQKALELDPIELQPWDPFGSLAD